MSALLDLINKRKAATSGRKTINPKPGRNRYRILPGWKNGDPIFYADFGQHFIKDAAGKVVAVFVCADKTHGRPCEVCNAIEESIRNTTDDLTLKQLKDAQSGSRVLLNVLELDGPMPTTPQVLAVPPSVFNGKKGVGGIIQIFDEFPDMLDPVKGNDIIIERAGTGMDTSYGVQIAGQSKPVPPDALTKLHDLDKFVATETAEAQARAITAVRRVAGLLAAPTVAQASGGLAIGIDAVDVSGDVVDTPAARAVDSASNPTAPAGDGVNLPINQGDEELDKLLAGLA